MAPDKSFDIGEELYFAQVAKAEKLNPFQDLAILDGYGQAYGIDPDKVYLMRFDTVMSIMLLWKEKAEYQQRLARVREAPKSKNK